VGGYRSRSPPRNLRSAVRYLQLGMNPMTKGVRAARNLRSAVRYLQHPSAHRVKHVQHGTQPTECSPIPVTGTTTATNGVRSDNRNHFMSDWADHFLSLDVETTGFSRNDRVIEIAVVHWRGAEEVRAWCTLVRPVGFALDGRPALEVNGILPSELRKAKTFAELADRLTEELDAPIWVMHCASFDRRFLRQEFERVGARSPEPRIVACTRDLDEVFHPTHVGYKLAEVAKRWGLGEGTHRALADARIAGRIFLGMRERLPESFRVMTPRERASWAWKG
jgi:DNA polymerase III epsilon subunit-like protein